VSPAQSTDLSIESFSHEASRAATHAWIRTNLGIVGLALVALALKLMIASNTFGTNDVVTFYHFGKALNEKGLEWTYRHSMYFNHPPLIAYYLQAIYRVNQQPFFRDSGLLFPLLLRFPGIIADFITVVALCLFTAPCAQARIPKWALALFALSPVSLMVSGFHGNTDPVMVMFLVLASLFCFRGKPMWCGLFFALSCQIKVIPLVLLPIFFFFWVARRRAVSFSLPFILALLVLWVEPLLKFPTLFARNVLCYGSYWGIWGITYWLRVTNLSMFREPAFFYEISATENIVVTVLKLIIIVSILMLAWRRRKLSERALLDSVAYAWIMFFVFAPAVCAQYMVWLAPFALLLSPVFYGWLVASSSVFLFFFYDINSGEFPWYSVVSDGRHNIDWVPWSVWPWAVLVASLIIFWNTARRRYPSLRLLSLDALPMRL
jgi:Gpi18-like mannosyltransferase